MMNRPDWKTYMDGTMPLAERERLYQAMEQDPALRRDYEGYQAFVNTLRERALSEPLPAFKFLLPRPPLIRRSIAWAGVASLALAGTLLVLRREDVPTPMATGPAFPNSPEIDRLASEDASEATQWIVRRTSVNAPKIGLVGLAKLEAASYGKDWGGYEFTCSEGRFRVRFAEHDGFEPCKTTVIAGMTYYHADGLGWRQSGLSFMLSGEPGVPLAKFAPAIYTEVSRGKAIGIAHAKGAR